MPSAAASTAANSQWSWAGHANAVSTSTSQASTVPGMFFSVFAQNTSGASSSSNTQPVRNPADLPAWMLRPEHSSSAAAAAPVWEDQSWSGYDEWVQGVEEFNLSTPRTSTPADDIQLTFLPASRPRPKQQAQRAQERTATRMRNSAMLSAALAIEDRPSEIQSPLADHATVLPWWPVQSADEQIFHARTRLGENREGLLIDVGAIGNLVGEEWVMRQSQLAQSNGLAVESRPMSKPLIVEGVGKSSQSTCTEVVVPVATQHGPGLYQAPMIPNSALPALLGLTSIEAKSGVLDTRMKKLICPGPGGLEIRCSPGTIIYDLEKAESGHLLLPASEFQHHRHGASAAAFFAGSSQSIQETVYVMQPSEANQPQCQKPAAPLQHVEPPWPPGMQDNEHQTVRKPASIADIRRISKAMLAESKSSSSSSSTPPVTHSAFPASSFPSH